MPRLNKILNLIILIAFILFLLSFMLVIMHWPVSSLLNKNTIKIAFITIILSGLVKFIIHRPKTTIDYITIAFPVAFVILSILLYSSRPSYTILFYPLNLMLLVGWALLSLFKKYIKQNNETLDLKEKISSVAFLSAAILVVTGMILKIMHWPGGSILLIIGMVVAILWFIIDFLLPSSNKTD